jgi:hypothetical protein
MTVPNYNIMKMKNKKYHTVGTVLKSNIRIVEISHFPDLLRNFNKMFRVNSFDEPKSQ